MIQPVPPRKYFSDLSKEVDIYLSTFFILFQNYQNAVGPIHTCDNVFGM